MIQITRWPEEVKCFLEPLYTQAHWVVASRRLLACGRWPGKEVLHWLVNQCLLSTPWGWGVVSGSR
jgi:hypothetical protein